MGEIDAFSGEFSQFSAKSYDFGARTLPILSDLVELAQAQKPYEGTLNYFLVGPIVPLTIRYSPSSEVKTSSFTSAAINKPNLSSSLFLL